MTTEKRRPQADKETVDSLYRNGFRYASFGEYWRRIHDYKLFKVPVDADFLCPNWDSRVSKEGCIYCPGFGKEVGRPTFFEVQGKEIREQLEHQIPYHREKGAGEKFLAYFYPATNTYRRVSQLENLFNEALEVEGVVGLSVGTRPDCLPDEVLDLLESYVKEGKEVWVELGQQSYHYHTIEEANRGHGIAESIDVIPRMKERGIWVCNHIILGMPYETPSEMNETARILSVLGVDAVKIYPLLVMRGTSLARMYETGVYRPLGFLEYVNLACDFLEHLSPYVLIQRLSKDCGMQLKIAPKWNPSRLVVSPRIEKELARRNSRQGAKYKIGLSEPELEPLNKMAQKR